MTYAVGQDILDDEYNIFATGGASGTPNHSVANINTVWGVGTGDKGYGQSNTLSSVSAGGNVTATQWANMLARMDSMEQHQGNDIADPVQPTAGVDIDVFSSLSANITTLFNGRLDNAANGSDVNRNVQASAGWTDNTTHTSRFTWDSANEARYFWNTGGEFRISFSRTGGTAHAKNTEWTNLCNDCGTIVIGSRTLVKVGGAGTPNIEIDDGWYDISTAFVIKFKQFEATSPYTASFITVEIRTAASLTQLEVRVIYKDDAPEDSDLDTVDGTVDTTFTERLPSTAQIVDTWGGQTTPTVVTNTQA